MKKIIRLLTFPLLCAIAITPALAAVTGLVINNTNGQPQAGVDISLVQPGAEGMKNLGQTKSGADGAFTFDQDLPPGPALLQSTYAGVTYTQALPPGSKTTGVQVNVYESTNRPPEDMETQHLILLEPSATTLRISETFFTRNNSNTTYQDTANGSVRLYLPEGVPEDLRVTIDSVGVPIQRPVEKAKGKGQYKVTYPLKPGETRFDLEYSIPATATYSGRVFSNDPPVKLVTPGSVTLSGEGITDLGQEQTTQARVYQFKGNSFNVNILGVGSIRTPADTPSPEESGAPKCCEEVPARVNTQMGWVLGLSFGILAIGGALLYRRGTVAQ